MYSHIHKRLDKCCRQSTLDLNAASTYLAQPSIIAMIPSKLRLQSSVASVAGRPSRFLMVSFLASATMAWAVPIPMQVLDSEGKPLPGVTVEAQVSQGENSIFQTQTTDDQGHVAFEAVASARWKDYFGRFNAWKAEYALAAGTLVPGGAKVTLLPGVSVSGVVVDAEKKPVAGVKVEFVSAAGDDGSRVSVGVVKEKSSFASRYEVTSDAEGKFSLAGLPPKTRVTLSVSDPRFVATSAAGRVGGEPIQVSVRAGATLKGVLLDEAGAPVVGATVYASSPNRYEAGGYASAETDAQGGYLLTGLASGSYSVNFAAPYGEDGLPKLVGVPTQVSAVESKVTEVAPIRARSGVVVKGTVRDAASKKPVSGASVRAVQPGPVEMYTDTDAAGVWKLRVLPGSLKVSLNQAPPEYLPPNGGMSRSVEAPTGGMEGLDFEVQPAAKLTGRVVDEKGQGVKTKLVLSREYQEWPLSSDAEGNFTAYGPTAGEISIGNSMWNDIEDKDSMKWEVVRGTTFTMPVQGPLQVVVKPLVYTFIEGTVVDEAGAPVADAQVTLGIMTKWGKDRTTGTEVKVVTDAQGRYRREKLRPNDSVEVRAAKPKYDFASGGKATKAGDTWTVTPVVLRARNGQLKGQVFDVNGQPVAGAQIFAAGVETRSSTGGDFVLENLPSAEVEVVGYAGQSFGLAKSDGKSPVELKLGPVTLQKQDVALANQIIEEAIAVAQNTNYYAKSALRLNAVDNFENRLAAAEVMQGGARDQSLSGLILDGSAKSTVPTAQLLEATRLISSPSLRIYSAGILWSRRADWPDDAPTRAFVAELESTATEQAKLDDNDNWQRIIGLFSVAPIVERYQGEKAGEFAFNRAYAWILKKYPETKADNEGDRGGEPTRDDTLRVVSGLIAASSPHLFNRLLESISEPEAPEYSWSLEEGAVAIAKRQGLKAALPTLERLRLAPPLRTGANGGSVDWRYANALRRALTEGRNDAPEEALRLAKGLSPADTGNDDNQSRAIAEAAFALPLLQALPLWREVLPKLEPSQIARYAVRIAPLDHQLAKELIDVAGARFSGEDPNKNIWRMERNEAGFAFYEGSFDPARARYRLEKAWANSLKEAPQERGGSAMARAMAKFDGQRALEWARQLPQGEGSFLPRIEALRKIAQWIEADDETRQGVPFDRWGASDTWRFGDQEW